jgi:phage tail sheath protein FI
METYKTPGVSVKEIVKLPSSVAAVSTAIPAFIGYTQISNKTADGTITPVRITSLPDYEAHFGTAVPAKMTVIVYDNLDNGKVKRDIQCIADEPANVLYYHMQLYFANGGGPCYIVSIGKATGKLFKADFLKGLDVIKAYDEPTLLVFPEVPRLLNSSQNDISWIYDDPVYNQLTVETSMRWTAFTIAEQNWLNAATDEEKAAAKIQMDLAYALFIPAQEASNNYYFSGALMFGNQVYDEALKQCAALKNRFVIMDVDFNWDDTINVVQVFRGSIKSDNLEYGAAYYPALKTSISYGYEDKTVFVSLLQQTPEGQYSYVYGGKLSDLLKTNIAGRHVLYNEILAALSETGISLTPCAAIAGIYASTDRTHGVWKAPANIGLNLVTGVTRDISDEDQAAMNVDPVAGKSVNAIRSFKGKGHLVWGARTLAGNDNEWHYISVRRLFIMVEESVKKAIAAFVFEPNNATTWTKVQGMIENYLATLWRQGALQGAKPGHAFYVSVGSGKTMTPQDVLEGRMHVEIGMAAVRPAEFIILRFSHTMAGN